MLRYAVVLLTGAMLAGCAVETNGTRGLPAKGVATLTARGEIHGIDGSYVRLFELVIDGKAYPVSKSNTQFRLTPGEHEILPRAQQRGPLVQPQTPFKFPATAGTRYRLMPLTSSDGTKRHWRIITDSPTPQTGP